MNIAIRRADLETDRELLIDTLFQYLTPLSDGQRFDWLYRKNPYGQAQVWIAVDADKDLIVGIASAFPRRIYVGMHEELGWVLGDFCIHEHYRSLGPALQLQRACFAAIDTGAATFCYDFPSARMMAIYARLHMNPFGYLLRLAKPLRVDRSVRKIVPVPVLARGVSAAGNLLLALSTRRPKNRGALTITLHEGQCGEEFSTLAQSVGGQYGACVQRSAAYLNWRYLANPLHRYELLTARRDGTLVAYVVFTQSGEDATLGDLFGVNDFLGISELVDSVVALLRGRGVVTVSAPMLESHPWVPLLQRLGFRSRDANPVVLYISPHAPSKQRLSETTRWCLMHGDRDS